jgi:hypothetical protein
LSLVHLVTGKNRSYSILSFDYPHHLFFPPDPVAIYPKSTDYANPVLFNKPDDHSW